MSFPAFTAEDWFTIKDRGDVASVRIDRDCRKDELLQTFRRVVIDGDEYEVSDVESWCLETIRRGSPIGLLVKSGRRPKRRRESR